MTEFKIGDKVRVLTNEETSLYGHSLQEGSVGTVVGLGRGDVQGLKDYDVEAHCSHSRGKVVTQILHSSELELVNE